MESKEQKDKIREDNKNFIDKLINFVFSKDERKYLTLILLLALIIRFIVVSNVYPVADEMVHGTQAIDFLKKDSLSHMTQGPVWFYLSDFAYNLFGVNLFSLRFLSFFFGFLSIIVVYLLASQLFDKKVALISAFLLSISAYFTRYALSYMDETMIFFVLLATYFFIRELKKSGKISLLSAVFLGVAMLVKIIAADFIIVFALFIIFLLYQSYKNNRANFSKMLFRAILFFVIILLLFSPVLVYNYLLYKDKGIVDLVFAMYFNFNREFYQGPGLAHNNALSLSTSFSFFKDAIFLNFLGLSPIEFILAIFGIFLAFKYTDRKKKYLIFLLALFLSHFCILLLAVNLPTHYAPFLTLFVILSSITLIYLARKLEVVSKGYLTFNRILAFFLIIIFIFNIYSLRDPLLSKSGVGKMRDFAVSSIDQNSLVLVDGRIYRGRIAWMFNDKHYIESSLFDSVNAQLKDIQNQPAPIKTYFIECVVDDCGWGTIASQPDFNASMESVVEFFKNNSQNQFTIYGGGGDGKSNEPYFQVYETTLLLKPQILPAVDQTHEWFFYPVRYKMADKIYDKYTIHNEFDGMLNSVAFLILYIAIGIAIISPILLFYQLFKLPVSISE